VSLVWCCKNEDNFQKKPKKLFLSASLRLCVKKEPALLPNIGSMLPNKPKEVSARKLAFTSGDDIRL
jgi:hypothetical protein